MSRPAGACQPAAGLSIMADNTTPYMLLRRVLFLGLHSQLVGPAAKAHLGHGACKQRGIPEAHACRYDAGHVLQLSRRGNTTLAGMAPTHHGTNTPAAQSTPPRAPWQRPWAKPPSSRLPGRHEQDGQHSSGGAKCLQCASGALILPYHDHLMLAARHENEARPRHTKMQTCTTWTHLA